MRVMPILRERVANLGRYSGEELGEHLKSLERAINKGRRLGHISDDELKELIEGGYLSASKRYIDQVMEAKGKDWVLSQTIPDPENPNDRVIRPDSELRKISDELSGLIGIIYNAKQDEQD